MKSIARYSRFIIAGVSLLIAFVLSVQFSDRGLQFDVEKGGQSALAAPDSGDSYNLANGEVISQVLLHVQDKYVDPTRVKPNDMLVHSLDRIQNLVPEIVVTFDKPIDENPRQAKVQVNTESKTFRFGKLDSLWEMSFKLKNVLRFIQSNLKEDENIKFNEIEYAAINGMLHTLDPHSILMAPKHYQEMQTQTGGKFGGLGIVIGIRDGLLTVISPIEGTPASRAGIKAGDQITRIDDESTVNMSLNDAVGKLRGEPDSPVDIWVKRKSAAEPRKISIKRAIIKIESVESEMLSNKIGYLKIKNFQANTYSDMRAQLDKLKKKSGGLNGLVLDLRNNPGGLLDQAVKISDAFIKDGTLVSTVGFGNKLRDENKAREFGTEPEYPIVVLVDPGSASASEIVSGALKNHNRAIIVGDTTFGKGSVQVIYELEDGSALKITIAQYLTPGDISIQSVGIVPDIRLHPVVVDDKGVDLQPSTKVTREADLAAHLDHKTAKKGSKPSSIIRYSKQREPEFDPNKLDDDKFKEDFPIRFAQRLVSASGTTFQRDAMLKVVEPELQKTSEEEVEKISAELHKLKVDWSSGATPARPKLEVSVTSDQENNVITAGETLKLTATVTNKGDEPIYRLRAVTDTENYLFNDREFVFGKLAPGETRTWDTKVKVPKHLDTREDTIKLKFGAMGNDIDVPAEFQVRTQASARPHFGFTYFIDDSKGNGDGVLQPNEEVTMHLRVTNNGKGDSEKTTAYLRNVSKSALFLTQGRSEPSAIKAGEDHTFAFKFNVKEVPSDGLKVEIEIYDEVYKEFSSEEISLLAEKSASQKVSNAKGAFGADKEVSVLSAAKAGSTQIARLPAGQKAVVTGKTGEMLRVKVGKDLFGWVKASEGSFQGKDKGSADAVIPVLLRTAPLMEVKNAVLTTDKESYKLEGIATDDKSIRDFYVYVYTHKNGRTRSKKIAYQRGSKNAQPINVDVPLEPGMNHIRVNLRDSDDMITAHDVYVYRK